MDSYETLIGRINFCRGELDRAYNLMMDSYLPEQNVFQQRHIPRRCINKEMCDILEALGKLEENLDDVIAHSYEETPTHVVLLRNNYIQDLISVLCSKAYEWINHLINYVQFINMIDRDAIVVEINDTNDYFSWRRGVPITVDAISAEHITVTVQLPLAPPRTL